MKNRILTVILIMGVLVFLSTGSCNQWESTSYQIGTSQGSMPANSKAKEPVPENSSQKWQEMMATDIDTLQIDKSKVDKGKVYAVSFHPQGQTRSIDAVDEINITFSEPVAPLKKAEKEESLIQTQPAIKGEGYWKSSTTYCFRVDEKLKLSTRYQVQFKGYKAFSGKIAEGKKWSFNTPAIKIIRSRPYHRSKWQTLDQKVLVHFSQDVNPQRISDFISIFTSKGKHPFNARYSNKKEIKLLYYYQQKEEDLKKFITITPETPYPMASDIRVNFLPGLPSMEGNIGMQREKELKFRTYEIFKILSVPQKIYPDSGVEVKLSNPAHVKEFRDNVHFEPKVDIRKGGNWNSDHISLAGNFKPGINYTMIVSADVHDKFGNRLGSEQRYTIQCQDFSPLFNPPRYNHFVFEDYLDRKIPIDVRNIFNSDVFYKKMERDEVKSLYGTYNFQLSKMNVENCNEFHWEIPIKKNILYTLGFDLDKINIKEPGFYYIQFLDERKYKNRRSLFQLTDIALVAKYSPTQIFLVPFNMKTGNLEKGLRYSIETPTLKGSESVLGQISGNEQGIAVFEPSLDILQKNDLHKCFVFSEPKKAFIWGTKPEMLEMWNFSYGDDYIQYNYSPKYYTNHLLAFTDKYLYKGGQTVKFKGILRQIIGKDMHIPNVKSIKAEVFNSRNQSIKKMEISGSQITDYGSFAGEFSLPDDAPTGYYRIELKGELEKTKVRRSVTFSVQEYKPAKFEVGLSFQQKTLIAGQPFSGQVNARYLFGTPMQGAEGDCTWTIQKTYFTPKGWGKYTFGTYDSFRRETIYKKDFQLDNDGNFKFERRTIKAPCQMAIGKIGN